eukprot:gene3713-13781_t
MQNNAPTSARVYAYAYDNPIFEDVEKNVGKKEFFKKTKEVDTAEQEALMQIFYPDTKHLLKWLVIKFAIVMFLVLANVLLIAYTDPFTSTNSNVTGQALIIAAQIALVIALMIAFFILTNRSLLVELGQYDQYFERYWWFYTTWLAEFGLLLGVRVYYIVNLAWWQSQLGFFDLPGYTILWVIHRVVLLIFWIVTVYGSTTVFNPELCSTISLSEKDSGPAATCTCTLSKDSGPAAAYASTLYRDIGPAATCASTLSRDSGPAATCTCTLSKDSGPAAAYASILYRDSGPAATCASTLSRGSGLAAACMCMLSRDSGPAAAYASTLSIDSGPAAAYASTLSIEWASCALCKYTLQRQWASCGLRKFTLQIQWASCGLHVYALQRQWASCGLRKYTLQRQVASCGLRKCTLQRQWAS